ncbi:MAG TPA: D-amino-acid transaminase [Rhizobiales bacterium]|nr:D-amino-acid transaminase [Hyphomicrobiales bacterium]
MGRTVFVNGVYLDEADATISVFDRGFLFGDGVYEVVPVMDGVMIDVAPFLARLSSSLEKTGIAWPCSREDYLAMHEELIRRNNIVDGLVYSQVTRGVAERDFAFPKDTAPTLMAFTQVKKQRKTPLDETGVEIVTVEDIRWKRRDIKSISLLAQCMAKQAAIEKGGFEGWMTEDGFVTEGTSSSALIVRDGVLITRNLSNGILPGIRRKLILQLARDHQISVEERPFSVAEALEADEALMSSASVSVLPVVKLDGKVIGDGKPGPVFKKLRLMYLDNARKTAGI